MEVSINRASRIGAIKAYVLAEIANPDLCLSDIAAQQGISSSYVRKLFAAEGTRFTAFVLETRLQNVCQMLADPETRVHSVSTIAMMCGFNDVSYFNRVFRRRYGCTPSDLRFGRGPLAVSMSQPKDSSRDLPRDQQAQAVGFAELRKTGTDQR